MIHSRIQARYRRSLSTFVLLLGASACAETVSVKKMPLPSAVVERSHELIDEKLLRSAAAGGELVTGELDKGAYRVGPGDVLLVAVYGHPELSISQYGGGAISTTAGRATGLVIDNDGTVQFPLVGPVNVTGKTSAQLSVYLEAELARYIKDPKVTVQVMVNGSIRYHLIGQFTNPGLKFSDRPLRLLEVIALGGSIILDRASLRGAYVARGDKRLPINFRTLLREGDLKQNIAMRPGDVVFVPDDSNEVAFVFGAVAGGTARGGAIPFMNGQLEITQALAQAGYGFRERALGRLSRTRVIRSNGNQGELFTVNVAQILKGDAAPFPLMPGDVVFVPASAMATWNQALEQLLPTLQTVSGILTPFVQYKYLTDDDN